MLKVLEDGSAIELFALALHDFAGLHVSCVPTAGEVVIVDDGVGDKDLGARLHCLGVAFVEEVVEACDEAVAFEGMCLHPRTVALVAVRRVVAAVRASGASVGARGVHIFDVFFRSFRFSQTLGFCK